MKKYILTLLLFVSFFAFKNIDANVIRLYQEGDHAILRAMMAGNEDLLLPGADLESRILATVKFFGSKNYTTKVYVNDEKPIGFITYQKELSGNRVFRWILGSPGCIQLFNVHEGHRRQGIGVALINDALVDMKSKGFDAIILQTKVANIPARAFYEKHGFILSFPVAPGATDCLYKLTN